MEVGEREDIISNNSSAEEGHLEHTAIKWFLPSPFRAASKLVLLRVMSELH